MKTILSFRAHPSVILSVAKNLFLLAVIAGLTGNLTSCQKWTEIRSVDINYAKPWDRDPALWEKYKTSLRDYKSRPHFLFYARFDNGAEKPATEAAFMRSLPDSLDFVSLTNADNFSAYDKEDMAWMESLGTKVLYQIDLDKKAFTETTALDAYLDKVIGSVKENGLNGYSFTATWKLGNAQNDAIAAALVTKLDAAKEAGQYLVFEGNPQFIPAEYRDKVDYYVLDSEDTAYAQDLRFQVLTATDYAGIPASKLLLGSDMDGTIQNEEREKCHDVEELAKRVVSFGPLAGLGISNIASDYYSYSGNYVITRSAIQLLNPSH